MRSKGRKILEKEGDFQLRDGQDGYGDGAQFNSENSFHWNLANKIADSHIPSNVNFSPKMPSLSLKTTSFLALF